MSGVALNCVALGGSALCRYGSEERTPDGRHDPFPLVIRHCHIILSQRSLEIDNSTFSHLQNFTLKMHVLALHFFF